jgi:anaerobic magnesium-protoporphyrin IX monomethyl ester cyclase
MARIVFISPPYLDLYGKLNRAAGRYFPLGLGYIASYLRKYGGHEVRMYEPEAQGIKLGDFRRILQEFQPNFVGLTCSTPNFYRAVELAKLTRESCHARIVLGGVHASALPELVVEQFREFFDCVVVGEGEQTMLELVETPWTPENLANVEGIVWLRDGTAIRNKARALETDLDKIPFPARDLIAQHLFVPNLHNARHPRCVSLLTSRGCPFNCSFCASRIVSGKKYRIHSAEYVVEEMELLKREYKAQQLLITDDTFTIDHARLEQICRGMIDRKLNLAWFCFSQVTSVTRDVLTLMKKAGCYSIGFGVESADEEILRAMGKPIKPERALTAVHLANELGIKTQAFYIFGFPTETREKMEATIAFAKKVNSTLAFFNMLVPYPGTREFEHYFAGVSPREIPWEDFVAVGEKCVLNGAAVDAATIRRLVAKANIEYYLHPKRLWHLARQIKTAYELLNYLRGGLSLGNQVLRWRRDNRAS